MMSSTTQATNTKGFQRKQVSTFGLQKPLNEIDKQTFFTLFIMVCQV